MVDHEKLASLMADFEQGRGDGNPFELENLEVRTLESVGAFAHLAARDTPGTDHVDDATAAALVMAGLLQGMHIGYAYARGGR